MVVLISFVIDLKVELVRKGNRRIVEVNMRFVKLLLSAHILRTMSHLQKLTVA